MAAITPITIEMNLGGQLAGDITSTDSTISVRHVDLKTGLAREPLATSLLFTIDKGNSLSENVLATAHTTTAGVTTYTGCTRGVSDAEVSVAAGTGFSHGEGAEVGHVTSHLPVGIVAKILDGTNGSGADTIQIGNETAADVNFVASIDHTTDPKLYWNDTLGRWIVTWGDDAPAFGDVDGVGVPVLTTAERDARTWPANGPIIYNMTTGEHQKRQGGAWVDVDSGGVFPNASETVAGKVEIATQAEIDAGTDVGGTGATLVVPPSRLGSTVDYTAAEALNSNVPVSKNGVADEVVNLVLKGIGTVTQFDAGTIDTASITKVSDNVVALIFRDQAGPVYLIAATINGNTVTYGARQQIVAVTSLMDVDITTIDTNKVAACYSDNNSDINVVVATLAGTVFTLGTPVVVQAGSAFNKSTICKADTNKLFVAWEDTAATEGRAAVATVSGTVPTFGAVVTFEAAGASTVTPSCCQLDTDKVLLAWGRNAPSLRGRGAVGSIAGTVLVFGAINDFDAAPVALAFAVSAAQLATDKAVISWEKAGNQILAIVADVAGAVITYGTAVELDNFSTGIAQIDGVRSCAALSSTKGIVVYSDSTTTTYYTSFTVSGNVITKGQQISSGSPRASLYANVSSVNSGDDQFIVIFNDAVAGSPGKSYAGALVGNANQYVGFTTTAAAVSATVKVKKRGPLAGFAGLTIGDDYYAISGGVTATPTELFVGPAKDTDEIDLTTPDPSRFPISTFNTKGDSIFALGNDSFDRLPVGADGEVITADSSEDLGAKWASAFSVHVGNNSRTVAAGTGLQAITGVGGTPKMVLVQANKVDSGLLGWCFGSSTGAGSIRGSQWNSSDTNRAGADNSESGGSGALFISVATASGAATGSISSFDSDGFTINWTSITGTGTVFFSYQVFF